ncbi:hypothetical protein BCR33DRAFT_799661 [Rhizoclosmatium globosum]|uniref:DUF6589 domain-containing protein n=1 Tax=Rhizoclosmatium globosum TaxID=329046 RepID=A0A1Y2A3G1_9FUNG|nr:hypothetical protein BCR33DRAFT_799661 [Rhizoclosmatium globosum]|eukprot:ORY17046.1 hypothetical protein BCR33DRAFT_799661 [Rhizoclosmatium globosum]
MQPVVKTALEVQSVAKVPSGKETTAATPQPFDRKLRNLAQTLINGKLGKLPKEIDDHQETSPGSTASLHPTTAALMENKTANKRYAERSGGKFTKRAVVNESSSQSSNNRSKRKALMPLITPQVLAESQSKDRDHLRRPDAVIRPTNVFNDPQHYNRTFLGLSRLAGLSNVRSKAKKEEAYINSVIDTQIFLEKAQSSSAEAKDRILAIISTATLTDDHSKDIISRLLNDCKSKEIRGDIASVVGINLVLQELKTLELGRSSDTDTDTFNVKFILNRLRSACPFFVTLLNGICGGVEQIVATVGSVVAFNSNKSNNYLQKHLGIILKGEGLTYSGFCILNTLGLSCSWRTTIREITKLSVETEMLISGNWKPFQYIGAYDNIERHIKTVEKTGKSVNQNHMLSQTMKAIIPVHYDDSSLSSTNPRIAIANLTVAHIMPTELDNVFFQGHLSNLVLENVIRLLPEFSEVKHQVLHPLRQTSKIMLLPFGLSNEKDMTAAGATKLCTEYITRLGVPASTKAELPIVGDVGTITNIRSAKWRRSADSAFGSDLDLLLPIKPVLGLFHLKMNYISCMAKHFKYDSGLFGSVGYFGKNIDKLLKEKKFDFYAMERVFLATWEVYLTALIQDTAKHVIYTGNTPQANALQLVEAVMSVLNNSVFREQYVLGSRKPKVEYVSTTLNPSRGYMIEFVKRMGWYKVYSSAVHYNDSTGIQSLHRLALPVFKIYAVKYANAIVTDLIQKESEESERCAYVTSNGMVVNPAGRPDTHFPVDLAVEFLNGDFKAMASKGNSVSDAADMRTALTCSLLRAQRNELMKQIGLSSRAAKHSDVLLTDDKASLLKDIENSQMLSLHITSESTYQVNAIDETVVTELINVYIPKAIKKANTGVLDQDVNLFEEEDVLDTDFNYRLCIDSDGEECFLVDLTQ